MPYLLRVYGRPATMNLIHWLKGALAPMEEKAAVSAGCWTVPNADIASRKATRNATRVFSHQQQQRPPPLLPTYLNRLSGRADRRGVCF